MSQRLEESLGIIPVTNTAKQGRIIELARGKQQVLQFCDGQEQINAYIIPQNGYGGKHFHPSLKDETGYTIYGKIRIVLEDPATRERYSTELSPGFKFKILRGLAHKIENIGDSAAVFLETATMEFEDGKDTVHYEM